jgi:hypothetical protein
MSRWRKEPEIKEAWFNGAVGGRKEGKKNKMRESELQRQK